MSRIRTRLKTAAARGLAWTGVGKRIGTWTGTSKIPAIISYHRIVEDMEESSRNSIASMLTSTRMFEQHIDWIGSRYDVISLDQLGACLESGKEFTRPTAAIAFDDGYRDVYENAFPLLMKKGIPATVFVVTGLLDTADLQIHDKLYLLLKSAFSSGKQSSLDVVELLRTIDIVTPAMAAISRMRPNAFFVMAALMDELTQSQIHCVMALLESRFGLGTGSREGLLSLNWEMVRTMHQAGITIGSHTRTHALLTNESRGTAFEETARSRRDIESRLGASIQNFAYPDGRHNADAIAAVAAAGYRFAYGTCRSSDPVYPLLTIPRKVVWENSCRDAQGRFSPALMECHMNWIFDLGSPCSHDHGPRALQAAVIAHPEVLSR